MARLQPATPHGLDPVRRREKNALEASIPSRIQLRRDAGDIAHRPVFLNHPGCREERIGSETFELDHCGDLESQSDRLA